MVIAFALPLPLPVALVVGHLFQVTIRATSVPFCTL